MCYLAFVSDNALSKTISNFVNEILDHFASSKYVIDLVIYLDTESCIICLLNLHQIDLALNV